MSRKALLDSNSLLLAKNKGSCSQSASLDLWRSCLTVNCCKGQLWEATLMAIDMQIANWNRAGKSMRKILSADISNNELSGIRFVYSIVSVKAIRFQKLPTWSSWRFFPVSKCTIVFKKKNQFQIFEKQISRQSHQ